jgi:hypothetical protein
MSEDITRYSLLAYVLCTRNLSKVREMREAFNRLCSILKVACNENLEGSGRLHTFGIGIGPWRSMFFWLLILLSSLF